MLRQPLITVLGHVDHGKTSLLDSIRQTTVVEKESGRITQAIGASIIPAETIKRLCADLIKKVKLDLKIPGLLFIDTPGHAAFSTLRRRGGNLADIAILVVDINEGLKPQTIEAIEILKEYKTPFVVALNKIDLINGWRSNPNLSLLEDISKQGEPIRNVLEQKMYEFVGELFKFGLNSDRFDRVSDFTKQIPIVPMSVKFKAGLQELLVTITGLAQKYLENNLKVNVKGPARGTILEVKETKGLGITIDVIIYDGKIKKGDTIIIGSLDKPIVTKVKALLIPAPLTEMMTKAKFNPINEAIAATGVKISAPELENVIAGMPLRVVDNLEKDKEEIQEEIEEVLIDTEQEGITVKADTIGALEALDKLLKEHDIPIKKASIGEITKKDIIETKTQEGLNKCIVGFKVKLNKESEEIQDKPKIILQDVIYKIIDEYGLWRKETEASEKTKDLEELKRPSKIQILPGCVFRQSNPAVVGIEVINGVLQTGVKLAKETKNGLVEITELKTIQDNKKVIQEAVKGQQVAVALSYVTVGRQIKEGDLLYANISEEEFRRLKELKGSISPSEIIVLKEISSIQRKKNPVWGV